MPPRKSSNSPTMRTNSRKRLSSQTEEQNQTLEDSTKSDESSETNSENHESQTNSSSNSEDTKDETPKETKTRKKSEEPSKARTAGAEPDGHIVRLGEELSIPATKHKNFAIVDKDVYREVQLRGTRRIAYQLVYTAGTSIPLSKLDQIK